MGEMKLEVDVARISSEGDELSGALDDAVLDMHDRWIKPFGGLRYELGAMLFGRELLLRGTLAQDFSAVCSRCGADFDFTVTVKDFTASFEVPEGAAFVDVTEELRQSLLLEVPNYPICAPTCEGVATKTEEAPDARWGALDALAAPSGKTAKGKGKI